MNSRLSTIWTICAMWVSDRTFGCVIGNGEQMSLYSKLFLFFVADLPEVKALSARWRINISCKCSQHRQWEYMYLRITVAFVIKKLD